MQMDSTKNYLAGWLERSFNKSYHSELTIGEVNGFIPFNIYLDDIRVAYATSRNSSLKDTLVRVDRINASIDVWSLLQNKISINSFAVESPRLKFVADPDERYTIYRAFSRRDRPVGTRQNGAAIDLSNIEIIAPGVTVNDGVLVVEEAFSGINAVQVPDPLRITDINAHMFLELSEEQRFWDIETLTAQAVGLQAGNIRVGGQVYNDSRYLEFNAFELSAGDSQIRLNGEVDGVDLYRENLREQLSDAFYNVNLASTHLRLAEFTDLFKNVPSVDKPLDLDLQTEGTIDSLWVDDFSVGAGESYLQINGLFQNLSDKEQLAYRFKVAEVFLRKKDIEVFSGPLDEKQFNVLENLQFNGRVNGTEDSLDVDLSLNSPYGLLELQGGSQLKQPFSYTASLSGKDVNLGDLIATGIDSTDLSFNITAGGLATRLEDAVMEVKGSVFESSVNDIRIDELKLGASLAGGVLEHDYVYRNGEQEIIGSGWADLNQSDRSFSVKGSVQNIDPAHFIQNKNVPTGSLDFDYNLELQGRHADQIHGRANLDVKPSVLGGDSLQAHQFYMDLDSPDQEVRTFRLTSSLFDLNMTGKITPSTILSHFHYWKKYAEERFRKEILLDGTDVYTLPNPLQAESLMLSGRFKAKNLALLKKYWPEFPTVETDTRMNFDVNADSSRLLISAKLAADSLRYDRLNLTDANAQLTASFRSDRRLKEYSSLDFETNISQLHTAWINMDSLMLDLAFQRDTLTLTQKVGSFADEARMNLMLASTLSDSLIQANIRDFYLGNDSYAWQSETVPTLVYNRNDKLQFRDFSFKNQDEFFELKGILSPDREDSLQYTVKNVNLERISNLIDGRIRFSGQLNGNLLTRSLVESPSVQGRMKVNRFTLQDRLVGDATFASIYNPASQRFNTQIKIITDPNRYENYLEENDDIGQDIVMEGYFIPPDPDAPDKILYDFDVDFDQIDMWVLPLIVKVFDTMEGEASGKGYLRGNLQDYDFHAEFQTSHVFAKPRFLETNYFLNGPVTLDRENGVLIDSVSVTDTQGGTGTLWGTVDLNDFKPITFLDLSLQLNELQILNNSYDPDVPFYGTVSGSGLVRLSGANTDLYLRTVEPVSVTDDSEVSIPLIEETELSQNNRFIQFVDTFDVRRRGQISLAKEKVGQANIDDNVLSEAIDELTFNERFDLDLQFTAPDNMFVDLIFDPVTGEVVTANGTGQLRITMQDEEVQMFGRYNITGGDYQFVSGEIFTRRLELESGGSISWQGDPENASLDISTVYRARPSLSSLNYQGQASNIQEGGGQRFPIDLILEITGTVSSVENNYYFRLPNSVDLSSSSSLSFTINQINRDEQQKLLQATSVLLTGNFIPTQSYDQATSSLSQSLTRGSTVINPLLSNQVISPLLSNQMNALLNSDVSRFDIDFNLNAYNEIDLGIALRLYNDKLIFRREGQITGGTENTFGERIGDLNATYRINKRFSVTAFHRQDQTLGNFTSSSQTGDISPSVDGIGFEAQVQFNTWQDLGDRFRSTMRGIFGIKDEDEKNGKLVTD